MIDGINTWAVGVVRYSAGIVDLAMNGCLHTRSNVARLYLPRKEGGRGLIAMEEFVRSKKGEQIPSWLPKREQRVDASSCVEKERRRKDEKVKNWKKKALHGAFVQQISDEAGEESWRWLRNEFLKKETKGLILAAQEQARSRTA